MQFKRLISIISSPSVIWCVLYNILIQYQIFQCESLLLYIIKYENMLLILFPRIHPLYENASTDNVVRDDNSTDKHFTVLNVGVLLAT